MSDTRIISATTATPILVNSGDLHHKSSDMDPLSESLFEILG